MARRKHKRKHKKGRQVRRTAAQAIKAITSLGKTVKEDIIEMLYQNYDFFYKPDAEPKEFIPPIDKKIIRRVYYYCKEQNYSVSFEDLEKFYRSQRKGFRRRQADEYKRRMERENVRLVFLGTANSHAKYYYNACFAIRDEKQTFLVDTGGGQTILQQLEKAQIGLNLIHDIFITHAHIDHILGLFFILRDLRNRKRDGVYEGELRIYGNASVIEAIKQTVNYFMRDFSDNFDDWVKLIELKNGDTYKIIDQDITFFDTQSEVEQYGLTMKTRNNVTFAYLGDVPFVEEEMPFVENVDYLLHEVYCIPSDEGYLTPNKWGHATLKDACENFEKIGAKELILTHTDDKLRNKRSPQIISDAEEYYNTPVQVPNDLDTIFLKNINESDPYYSLDDYQGDFDPSSYVIYTASDIELMAADDIMGGGDIADSIIDAYARFFEQHPEAIAMEDEENGRYFLVKEDYDDFPF